MEVARPDVQLTLDEKKDFAEDLLIKKIFEELYPQNPDFDLSDVLTFVQKHPQLLEMNHGVSRTVV